MRKALLAAISLLIFAFSVGMSFAHHKPDHGCPPGQGTCQPGGGGGDSDGDGGGDPSDPAG